MVDLKGKGAMITGGASGLGLAAAKEFIACGAQVLIADYNPKVGEIAAEIGAIGVICDVSKEEDVKKAMDKTVAEFGHIDIAVASAGVGGAMNDLANETLDNWNLVNGIDYTGVMLTDKYAIGHMIKQGRGGSVINIASMFGMVGVPNNIAYSGSKGGVVNMTRAAGAYYAPQGIRVNAICPGVIITPLISEEAQEQYRDLHPARRLGAVEEVAKLIAFIASDESPFITGAIIPIDGGYTAV
ncbi:MAG: SDR family oxidoreductase [Clostridiales bacterium]|jgi:NAD(P)-dependent dehydrogenase (short-subunit alcohol dehydrogenase family)|nr:SDR family oxidoreductase [Clostridiales bacterium]